MNKKLSMVALIAGMVAVGLVLAGCGGSAVTRRAMSGPVYISDCGYGESIKPDGITLACADGGIYVDAIKWSSWGGVKAKGIGIFHRNLCEPDCADGKYIDVPVRLNVSVPKSVEKKLLYSQIYLESTNGSDLILGEPTYATDLVTEGI